MSKTLFAAVPLMLAFCNQPAAPPRAAPVASGGSAAPAPPPVAPPSVPAHGAAGEARSDFARDRRGDEAVRSYAMTTRAARVEPIAHRTALAPWCTESRAVPSLVGSDPAIPALDAALDRESRALGTPLAKADCAGATESVPYERTVSYDVTGERPGFLGVTFSVYEFTGGAHGAYASRCVVADFARRDAVRLAADLSQSGRAKISRLAVRAFEREHHVAKLTEAGFFEDSPALGDAELCFVGGALRVEYPLYAIAPYVMGTPAVVLDASDVSGAFRPGTTGAALFP